MGAHRGHQVEKATANGLATLDANGLVPISQLPAFSKATPGEHLPGEIWIYNRQNNFNTASEIQYVRQWLDVGIVIDRMRTFVDAGGLTGRNVRMGIYDQSIPLSESGVPNNKVAETASTTTNAVTGFLTVNLVATYTVTTAGYYWFAIVTDSIAVDWAVTRNYPANFMPVRRESGTGVILPATASGLTNPKSGVAYCSAVDQ